MPQSPPAPRDRSPRVAGDGSADLVLLMAVSIWALNFTAVKVGIGEISPVTFPVFRFGLGAIVMALIVRRREGSLRFERRDAVPFLITGFVGITLNQLSSVFALELTTAANVALLSATQPIFTAVIATAVGDELLGRRHWLAVALGMVGVTLIVEGGAGHAASPPVAGAPDLPVGELLALLVSLTAAASSVTIRRLLVRYSAYRILAIQMLIGTALLLPVATPALVAQDYASVAPVGWVALAYSAVLAGVVTNLLYFTGIRRVGASRAAIYQYLQSFLGVLLAVAILAEPLGWLQVVGGAIVVASVVLSRRDPRQLIRAVGSAGRAAAPDRSGNLTSGIQGAEDASPRRAGDGGIRS